MHCPRCGHEIAPYQDRMTEGDVTYHAYCFRKIVDEQQRENALTPIERKDREENRSMY
jgi:hypothetical protein